MRPRVSARSARRSVVLTLAVLLPVWIGFASDAHGTLQDEDPQDQAEGRTDALAEELGRALGMTPAQMEALGLSPAEMQRLLAGFTEETVVVGSRAQPRSATESAVPVDVLSATDLVSQGAGDLKDQLRTIILPPIALRQVEVLRDGAAAQYGSDAIAGVMNFQLKDAMRWRSSRPAIRTSVPTIRRRGATRTSTTT